MVLVRGKTPEFQTRPQTGHSHLETFKKALLDAFIPAVGFKNAWEWDQSVDFEKLLANRANLPACIFRWAEFDDGAHLGAIPRAVSWENIQSTLLFEPKLSGTTTSTQAGRLVDSTQDFSNIKPGDVAAKVSTVPGGVELVAQTVVTAVGEGYIEVEDDIFPANTRYEIHYPLDVAMFYNTSRAVRLKLDMYADPKAPYGSGSTIEEVERKARAWWQTHLAQIILQLHDAVVSDEFRSFNLSGLVGEASKSFLHRASSEVGLVVGEIVSIPWPTVETVKTKGCVNPEGDSTVHEHAFEVSEHTLGG